MKKILIFGNSGSGKSTLARNLSEQYGLSHMDLDSVAWQPYDPAQGPPQRLPLIDSQAIIEEFTLASSDWVIEGCYADLLELVMPQASEIIFLNLSVSDCIANANQRPWEPHKYPSKAAQDANLEMLIEWIKQYDVRTDTFSRKAHQAMFDAFKGNKSVRRCNTEVPFWSPIAGDQ